MALRLDSAAIVEASGICEDPFVSNKGSSTILIVLQQIVSKRAAKVEENNPGPFSWLIERKVKSENCCHRILTVALCPPMILLPLGFTPH